MFPRNAQPQTSLPFLQAPEVYQRMSPFMAADKVGLRGGPKFKWLLAPAPT